MKLGGGTSQDRVCIDVKPISQEMCRPLLGALGTLNSPVGTAMVMTYLNG